MFRALVMVLTDGGSGCARSSSCKLTAAVAIMIAVVLTMIFVVVANIVANR